MKEILLSERDRLVSMLPSLDPLRDANTYRTVLDNIESLKWMVVGLDTVPVEGVRAIKAEPPYVEPTPFPEPSTEEYEPPVMDEKTYTKEEVRAALAQSRKNGMNVTELLAEFGAENFTGLPAAKYPEIMARLGAN